jgi:hypothetical protein
MSIIDLSCSQLILGISGRVKPVFASSSREGGVGRAGVLFAAVAVMVAEGNLTVVVVISGILVVADISGVLIAVVVTIVPWVSVGVVFVVEVTIASAVAPLQAEGITERKANTSITANIFLFIYILPVEGFMLSGELPYFFIVDINIDNFSFTKTTLYIRSGINNINILF